MKYVDEFRDRKLAKPLVTELHKSCTRPLRIMEVCGSHTMAIFRAGIRSVLPAGMELISGPGCPVCVTSAPHIDAFISLAEHKDVRITTFGDLFRVPGTHGSLANASSLGAQVEIVYSPMDALELAATNRSALHVFLGVGFETTTPTIAATIMAAKLRQIDNFCVFSTQKVMPPPLHALLQDPELRIDGLLCPGHVSSIIGASAYQELVDQYGLACVISGFETSDLLTGLIKLARQVANGDIKVENNYSRVVSQEGNRRAQAMVNQVFEPADMEWRGLGTIGASGLRIRDEYRLFDAEKRLDISLEEVEEPQGCLCGDILKGIQTPPKCPLFAKRCTPASPVGPCMVSSEGTCAAYHKYGLDPEQ